MPIANDFDTLNIGHCGRPLTAASSNAALDKFFAASPIVVAAVIEAYWLGAVGIGALSWRHHAVAALWSAFALTDFFATDITNQRLRARQLNVGDGT
jgi:hypothetical protein